MWVIPSHRLESLTEQKRERKLSTSIHLCFPTVGAMPSPLRWVLSTTCESKPSLASYTAFVRRSVAAMLKANHSPTFLLRHKSAKLESEASVVV